MSNVNEILEKLKSLTLLETSELVSKIEEAFGVDASASSGAAVVMAPTMTAAPSVTETTPKEEEKTLFDVILEEIPANRTPILKIVRAVANLELNAVKAFLETLPKCIKESVSKEEAETIKSQLEGAGAKVKIV
nr:ribosomal protein L12 [Cylindrocapsa geminella]